MSISRKKQQDHFFCGKRSRRVLRMAINLLTCLGAGIAFLSIPFAFQGNIREAWLLLGLAVLIDALDGTLVRWFDIHSLCPNFDGKQLDEYADLITFVIAPVAVAFAVGQLPIERWGILTAIIVIGGSALQFSYKESKTTIAFWGFPAYWNIVYFYTWALECSPQTVVGISLGLSVALFLPIPFIYPSRTPILRKLTVTLGIFWGAVLFYYLWKPGLGEEWIYGSLVFPVYYGLLSLLLYPKLRTENGDPA